MTARKRTGLSCLLAGASRTCGEPNLPRRCPTFVTGPRNVRSWVSTRSVPGKLIGQLVADVLVILWGVVWALIGTFIHDMISLVAVPARETARAAGRLAEDFQAAAQAANVPGVGDQLRRPFDAAANTMGGVISSANHQVTNIEQLATVVGWLVFLIPVSVVIAFGCRAASGSAAVEGCPEVHRLRRRSRSLRVACHGDRAHARAGGNQRRPGRAWRSGDKGDHQAGGDRGWQQAIAPGYEPCRLAGRRRRSAGRAALSRTTGQGRPRGAAPCTPQRTPPAHRRQGHPERAAPVPEIQSKTGPIPEGYADTSSPTPRPRSRESRDRRRSRSVPPPRPLDVFGGARESDGRQLAKQPMAWFVEVAWHLERQPAILGEELKESQQQASVVRHPLQCGVAEEHVDRHRAPATKISEDELDLAAGARGPWRSSR